MNTLELLKKIRLIEIKTKGLTNQFFKGKYHASFKGRGMTFSEVRGYQIGDEVRTIDWNVTARFNEPYVKVFEEERELIVMLIIDISASNNYGSRSKSKKELILELMAVIGFSAVANNDKVGALFISDGVEKFIPPAKGKKHILFALREYIDFEPKSNGTDLNVGFHYFRNCMKKRSVCFVISDFLDEGNFEEGLSLLRSYHDVIALQVTDPAEKEMIDLGLIQFYNAENGTTSWVNTSDISTRKKFKENAEYRYLRANSIFKKLGINYEEISTTDDYIPKFIHLFRRHK